MPDVMTPPMPRKVLRSAHTLGVHNDCIVSNDPCSSCAQKITLAFDRHYAHCETWPEMLGEVVVDIYMDTLNLEDDAA